MKVKSMASLLAKQSLSNKQALNVLLKKKGNCWSVYDNHLALMFTCSGHPPNELWEQVDHAIQKVSTVWCSGVFLGLHIFRCYWDVSLTLSVLSTSSPCRPGTIATVATLCLLAASLLFFYKRHFFELVRFDFVIDDKFKVWLMEVSVSIIIV